MPDDPKPRNTNPMAAVARYSEIGFIIPAAVLVGYFLGRVADYYVHTKWLYLVGLILGAVVGFTEVIRMAARMFKDKS
jgi:F0F1-type ATP synthase assembly protein I